MYDEPFAAVSPCFPDGCIFAVASPPQPGMRSLYFTIRLGRHIQRPTANHYRIAASLFQTGLYALVIPDFAIRNHRIESRYRTSPIACQLMRSALHNHPLYFDHATNSVAPACCTASAISNCRASLSQPSRTFTVTFSKCDGTASRMAFAPR